MDYSVIFSLLLIHREKELWLSKISLFYNRQWISPVFNSYICSSGWACLFFFPSLIPLFTCDLFSRFSIPFLRCFGGFYEILQSILQSCRMPEVHTKSYWFAIVHEGTAVSLQPRRILIQISRGFKCHLVSAVFQLHFSLPREFCNHEFW